MYQNAWDKIVLKRGYVAVVNGKLNNKQDTIKSYLKETKTLFVYSSNKKDGKLAITSYKVLKEQTDKISNRVKESNSENIDEATTALEVLGYSQKQIKEVMSKLDLSKDSVENIIRKVLKEMQNF